MGTHASMRVASRPPAPKPRRETFSSAEVAQASGATLRQLQWWDEQGHLQPGRDGHARVYSQAEAVLACVAARMRKAADSMQKVGKIVKGLAGSHQFQGAIAVTSPLWLIVGKKQLAPTAYRLSGVKLLFSAEAVMDELRDRNEYGLLICVHDIVENLEDLP